MTERLVADQPTARVWRSEGGGPARWTADRVECKPHDASARLQARLDNGDPITLRPGDTWIGEPLTVHDGSVITGPGMNATGYRLRALPGMGAPLITGSASFVTLAGFSLRGDTATGSKGVHSPFADRWTLRDLWFDWFADQAIHFEAGMAGLVENAVALNCLLDRNRSELAGVVDVACTDQSLRSIEATASTAEHHGGNLAAFALRGSNTFAWALVGELSDVGFHLPLGSTLHTLTDCRADLNYGHGFDIACSTSEFVGCLAYRNSRAGDQLHDGFVTTNGQNSFVACRVDDLYGDPVRQRHAFTDAVDAGQDPITSNEYVACRKGQTPGSLLNVAGTTVPRTLTTA